VPHAAEPGASREVVELTAAVNPIYFGPYASFYSALLASLKEKGFVVRPVTSTMPEFLERQKRADTDLSINRWVADFPDADTFASGVASSHGGIVGGYCGNEEIDRLVARGRAESDPGIRHGVYREVEEILAKEALVVPLFHDQLYRFGRPEIAGLNLSFSPPYVDYATLSLKR
jgi:ABC-type oligopeptide transport system substrate-binding subunit